MEKQGQDLEDFGEKFNLTEQKLKSKDKENEENRARLEAAENMDPTNNILQSISQKLH